MPRFRANELGGTVAEYAILLSLIAAAIVAAVFALGGSVSSGIESARSQLETATGPIDTDGPTDPGGGSDIDPERVSLGATAVSDGATWRVDVDVTADGPDGASVVVRWTASSGATGTASCVLLDNRCSLTAGPLTEDDEEVVLNVGATGGDDVVVRRP